MRRVTDRITIENNYKQNTKNMKKILLFASALVGLLLAGSCQREEFGLGGGDGTGIESVTSNNSVGGIYDLQGRKVENPEKGIYIVNGKKILVK